MEVQSFFTKESGSARGLYCKKCGKWIKWLGKEELRLFEHEQSLKNQKLNTKTSELFEKEIAYIHNEILQNIVRDTLDIAPECIQTIPASSSGRFHPKADLGEGGLVRHIKTVTYIAKSMIGTDIFKNIVLGVGTVSDETVHLFADIAIAACILHDCMKPDDTPQHKTVFDHPIKAANLFKETASKYTTKENIDYIKTVVPLVYSSIASHMGQFNTSPYVKEIVLPKPKLGIEHFVHLCDYIASLKFIDFNFKVYKEMIGEL